jgi:hypothetical protein
MPFNAGKASTNVLERHVASIFKEILTFKIYVSRLF